MALAGGRIGSTSRRAVRGKAMGGSASGMRRISSAATRPTRAFSRSEIPMSVPLAVCRSARPGATPTTAPKRRIKIAADHAWRIRKRCEDVWRCRELLPQEGRAPPMTVAQRPRTQPPAGRGAADAANLVGVHEVSKGYSTLRGPFCNSRVVSCFRRRLPLARSCAARLSHFRRTPLRQSAAASALPMFGNE
jgi:hypothetical protein